MEGKESRKIARASGEERVRKWESDTRLIRTQIFGSDRILIYIESRLYSHVTRSLWRRTTYYPQFLGLFVVCLLHRFLRGDSGVFGLAARRTEVKRCVGSIRSKGRERFWFGLVWCGFDFLLLCQEQLSFWFDVRTLRNQCTQTYHGSKTGQTIIKTKTNIA
jgi:hypothetical protein